jgi:hypothetical protein
VSVNRVPYDGAVWMDRYSGTVRDVFTVYCQVPSLKLENDEMSRIYIMMV